VTTARQKYMPDDDYIQRRYSEWNQSIHQLPTNQLTRAVIHGDVGPKDFFFEGKEFTGILDFGAAHLDFLLFDVASMMMYSQLYHPDRMSQFRSFMTAYLETAPLKKEELRWLHLLFQTRAFIQIFYHQYRYDEEITQGLDTADENLKGVADGKQLLKITSSYTPDHYFTTILNR
jgi:Ser/Thr protein kinase RdoA (MazF antagonist)